MALLKMTFKSDIPSNMSILRAARRRACMLVRSRIDRWRAVGTSIASLALALAGTLAEGAWAVALLAVATVPVLGWALFDDASARPRVVAERIPTRLRSPAAHGFVVLPRPVVHVEASVPVHLPSPPAIASGRALRSTASQVVTIAATRVRSRRSGGTFPPA